MRAPSVAVIGSGVAGTAAAWSASLAGAQVVLIGELDGASRLLSGAFDIETWETDSQTPQPADPQLAAFCDALGIWKVGERDARVASAWGIVRTARGRDRAVLDLHSMRDARVAVLRTARADWNADMLAAAWRSDPWCIQHDLRFEPISVDLLEHDHERFLCDAELAAAFDDPARQSRVARLLRDRLAGFDAVLTGPWLGVDTDAASAVSAELRRPVGEALSLLASSAGWRFVCARDRLMSKAGVSVRTDRVTGLSMRDRDVVVRCAGSEDITADMAVIACGGIAAGGLSYDPSEADPAGEIPGSLRVPVNASFASPAAVAFEGRPVRLLASMFGAELERFAWPALAAQPWPLDTASFVHRAQVCLDDAGRELSRLLVAGQAASARHVGALGAALSGIAAGRVACSRTPSR